MTKEDAPRKINKSKGRRILNRLATEKLRSVGVYNDEQPKTAKKTMATRRSGKQFHSLEERQPKAMPKNQM